MKKLCSVKGLPADVSTKKPLVLSPMEKGGRRIDCPSVISR